MQGLRGGRECIKISWPCNSPDADAGLQDVLSPFEMARSLSEVGRICIFRLLPWGYLSHTWKLLPSLCEFDLTHYRTVSRLLGRNYHDCMSQGLRRHFEMCTVVNKTKAMVVLFILPESTSGICLYSSENIWLCFLPGWTEMNYFSDPTRAFLSSPSLWSYNLSFTVVIHRLTYRI